MAEPERTEDGRYIVVGGRKWRASDPSIPEKLRTELVKVLMDGRRRVKTDGDAARPQVHAAKVALGERGDPWWEPTDEGTRERLAAAMRTLLTARDGTTICPSDAARVCGGETWRDLMPTAREVAWELHDADEVRVMQKGEVVQDRGVKGPVRIARRQDAED